MISIKRLPGLLKDYLLNIILYETRLQDQATQMRGIATIEEWVSLGRPIPGPAVYKESVVKGFQSFFQTKELIETGTFTGEMVDAVKDLFPSIISIEIDKKLARRAKRKFKKYPHIHILEGDSAEVLPRLIQEKKGQCIYWLDGHYSGGITGRGEKDTPIVEELNEIFKNYQNDIILIDDARSFNLNPNYPTIEVVTELCKNFVKDINVEVKYDIIRIYRGHKIEV